MKPLRTGEFKASVDSRRGDVDSVNLDMDVLQMLDCQVDYDRLAALDFVSQPEGVTGDGEQQVDSLLQELELAFDAERLDAVLSQTREDIIRAISVPFGFGKLLSGFDQVGGTVNTVHNVREGVYASEKEREAYEQRGEYDEGVSRVVHSDKAYVDSNRKNSKARDAGGVTDGYSGETLTANDKVDQDHVVSAKTTHDDPGRVLAEIKTEKLANIEENLLPTDRSVNRSKGKKSAEEYAVYLEETRASRQARIAELEASGERISEKEQKELNKLKKLEKVNTETLRDKGETAKKSQDQSVNKEYYTSRKFINSTVQTSLVGGARMGAQQAFGLMVAELFSSAIDEIQDVFRNGRSGKTVYRDLKMRLERVGKRIVGQWENAVNGFKDGFVAGFVSNLVTVLVNTVATTGSRVVRMIREGFLSLLKALRMFLFPSEGLTRAEAAHEAMKLVAVGGGVVAGVVLEELVEKILISVPVLAPISSVLTAVIVGAFSAICMALATYLIDKIDLFGAQRQNRRLFLNKELDFRINTQIEECNELFHLLERKSYL